MEWRALVIVGVATALGGWSATSGCRATTPGTAVPPAQSASSPPVASATTTSPPVASTSVPGPTAEQILAVAIEAARQCDEPAADITNSPPKNGTVFNNAQTDPDAGYIDRLAGIVSAIRDNPAYGCCFDVWQSQHPDLPLEISLRVRLDPEGEVVEAGVHPERTSTDDAVLIGCLGSVARRSSFPPSPTGKDTHVDYPFVVAARELSAHPDQ